jgi:2-phospho-L-lactate guanylyltransferase
VGQSGIIVVSQGADVLDFVKAHGAIALAEQSPSGLNSALQQAAEFARDRGASKLLVAASDLPFVSEADLTALALHDCAIAPDRHGRGTNALLWPASPLPGFHFGENSFARHREAAKAAGYEPQIVVRPGLAHDIDLPADLIEQSKS